MHASHIPGFYRQPLGLALDFYHLTMAYGFWKQGLYDHRAVFNLFYRKNPFGHPYTITAGLQLAMDAVERFRFSPDDIQYLGQLRGDDGRPLFELSFLNYLQRLSFRVHIDAMPEGAVAFPQEPILRVEGSLIEAQIIESLLLNLLNFSTLIATKAARICGVAGDDPVIEFGLRRAQGLDGALTASRSAYIGGCHGTSNVLAGRHYGIPVKGTHAHSWVMVFGDELQAFRAYADALPGNCIFLVDTYDSLEGVRHAIEVGRELRARGYEMAGIRLDSGDLTALSIQARQLLDEAGFPQAVILASDRIDEEFIQSLRRQGGRVDAWGIGTELVTAFDQPALGGVYKLAALRSGPEAPWEYRVKRSETAAKASTPGIQQVRRYIDDQGIPVGDVIYDLDISAGQFQHDLEGRLLGPLPEGSFQDLLVPVFRDGKRVYDNPSLEDIRRFSLEQQELFKKVNWKAFRVGLEAQLSEKKQALIIASEKALAGH